MGFAQLGGGLSGAASGAAAGSTFGPWGTAIGAIGGGLLGFLGGQSNDKAAAAAAQAAKAAAGAKEDQLRQGLGVQQTALTNTQNLLSPYTSAGTGAMGLLGNFLGTNGHQAQADAYGNFQFDPGYQAANQQGINAVQNSAAAQGGLNSGGAMKSLYNWGQQFAQQNYQNRISNLYQMAGMGQQSAGMGAQLGQVNANQQSGLYGQIGDAQAMGIMGPASINMGAANMGNNSLMAGLGALGGSNFGAAMKPVANNLTSYFNGGGLGSWAPSVSYGG